MFSGKERQIPRNLPYPEGVGRRSSPFVLEELKKMGERNSIIYMDVNFPKLEEEILERWKKEKAFEKSVARRKGSRRFVFYEGPPTANGKPGIHHVLSRAFKDVILRYKTMRGFFVERRAGWDTHGLPVELQIEKKLGLKSKKDIEKYGIAQFNKECKQSVWEYKKEWEALTERMGFWIDLNNPYITYETPYIETLWRIIQTFWQKGLLYKGHKVVPYCSRCGTPLSSHELAQGYKTVEDRSVYVKFQIEGFKIPTFFVAWTTTPWTLPGNVALAVNTNIEYIEFGNERERLIIAREIFKSWKSEGFSVAKGKARGTWIQPELGLMENGGQPVRHMVEKIWKGKDFIGLKYRPLFRFKEPEQGKKVWEVVAADFVSTKEGTGIVHTAVAYGVEDFELGKKENLAMMHLVNEEGKFNNEVTPWKGMFVKDADPLIIEDLKNSGALFKEELYEHEYPFCWRCSTPLLYYAKDSWFVNMQKVKKELIVNNKKISWVPAHLKEGRMGEWLREVKDWAFSRERYWGTPLPIWECKTCAHTEVVGSLEELQEKTRSRNAYYILRHGHSERQLTDVMSSWPEPKPLPLTPKGILQIEKAAKELKKKNVNIIFSSDLLRTKQTAEIMGKALGIKPLFDKRLREVDVGALNGRPVTDLGKVWGRPDQTSQEHYLGRFVDPLPEGESYVDVQKRMYGFAQDIDKKYKGKNILIVSHELPLTLLETTIRGLSRQEMTDFRQKEKKYLDTGEWRQIPFATIPFNETMELDFHRPYIDEVQFFCQKCGTGKMERVKDVVDVWFDSGAMPFAQGHWMGGAAPKLFPADYIVEGIDQTRGWFYTLLAISTLLGFKNPYKNVISFSHVLDEKGEKMSKSKGNVVNPWDVIGKFGIDVVRWYFFTINNPGDPKLFSEKDIQDVLRKFMLTLWNSFVFYQTYVPKPKTPGKTSKTSNVLDHWILSRLSTTVKEVTTLFDAYDVTGAGRSLENFVVNDLSLWYVRRSRTRFQNPASAKDFQEASTTLSFVLLQTSKLAAPCIPFLSEHIHDSLKVKGSVHWEDWPKAEKRDEKLEREMGRVRDLVTKALAERAKAQIKVRQPLSLLRVKGSGKEIRKDLLTLLKDEVNVKGILFNKNLKSDVELDTVLTPDLKEEGQVREILRSIQEMRKEAGYKPGEKAVLYYEGNGALVSIFKAHQDLIVKSSSIQKFVEGKVSNLDKEKQVSIEDSSLWLGITKT